MLTKISYTNVSDVFSANSLGASPQRPLPESHAHDACYTLPLCIAFPLCPSPISIAERFVRARRAVIQTESVDFFKM